MNSSRDICIAFSIISSSVSCSANLINRVKKEKKWKYNCKFKKSLIININFCFFKRRRDTYNWNRHDTMIQAVNDRIRTLALVLGNLLYNTMTGRAHLGSKIFAFWWYLMQGYQWRYFDSLHSYCLAAYRSFW